MHFWAALHVLRFTTHGAWFDCPAILLLLRLTLEPPWAFAVVSTFRRLWLSDCGLYPPFRLRSPHAFSGLFGMLGTHGLPVPQFLLFAVDSGATLGFRSSLYFSTTRALCLRLVSLPFAGFNTTCRFLGFRHARHSRFLHRETRVWHLFSFLDAVGWSGSSSTLDRLTTRQRPTWATWSSSWLLARITSTIWSSSFRPCKRRQLGIFFTTQLC